MYLSSFVLTRVRSAVGSWGRPDDEGRRFDEGRPSGSKLSTYTIVATIPEVRYLIHLPPTRERTSPFARAPSRMRVFPTPAKAQGTTSCTSVPIG